MNDYDSDAKWWIADGDQYDGPYSVAEIRRRLRSAELTDDRLVCPVGGGEWKAVTDWADAFADSASGIDDTPPPPPPIPTRSDATAGRQLSDSSAATMMPVPDTDSPENDSSETESYPSKQLVEPEAQRESDSDDNEEEEASGETPALLVGGGVAIIVVAWFWFALILWGLFIVAVVAALGCGISAARTETKSKREDWLIGAGIASIAAFGLWMWIGSYSFDVPKLGAHATAKDITDAYRNRVVHIRMGYKSQQADFLGSTVTEGGVSGSGLLIVNDRDLGIIVTNRHVIDPLYSGSTDNVIAALYEVSLASEVEWHEARVVAIHKELDLALLILRKRFPSRGAVQIATHDVIEQGDEVVALGNPMGVDFVTTERIVSKSDDSMILTTCPINPGNSGGPLILKNRGLVAGFNTITWVDLQNVNGAIIAERVFPRGMIAAQQSNQGSSLRVVLLNSIQRFLSGLFRDLSSNESDPWDWVAEREQVLELLDQVPIVHSE